MSLNSEFINNVKAIVSADVSDIKLSKDFVTEYNITEKEWKWMEEALHFNSGMTEYQCQHFVTDSQITPWRKTRQALMELETRYHSYIEIRTSLRKAEVIRKKFLREIENSVDDLEKELTQINLEKNDYDITIWKRKLKQAQEEIRIFLDIIDQYVDEEHPIEYYTNRNEEEERIYWIARMGKQAAMDIISYGRIGAGNMSSIMEMGEEDQVKTLEIAVKYSGMIGGGIDKMHQLTLPEIQNQLGKEGIALPKLEFHKYNGQFKLKGSEE